MGKEKQKESSVFRRYDKEKLNDASRDKSVCSIVNYKEKEMAFQGHQTLIRSIVGLGD